MSEKEQVIRLETAEELRANLPLSGSAIVGKLGAELERGSTIDIALALVGKRSSSRPWVTRKDLQGDCDRATHFVRSASIGAFAMKTGSRAKLQSSADLFGISAGGKGESSQAIENHDGSLSACRTAEPANDSPPAQCRSPLRIELRAIRSEPPAAETPEDDAAAACPKGLVATDDGKCSTPRPNMAHICSPDDVVDCGVQCEKGSMTSCTILGRSYMVGRGIAADRKRARALFEKACAGKVVQACARLGEFVYGDGDHDGGRKLLLDACSAGWSQACDTLGKLALASNGDKPVDVFAMFKRSCLGGDPEGCWSLGSLFWDGITVRQNDAEALNYFQLACTGGARFGCVSLAHAIDEGRGTPSDPTRAVELLLSSCDRGFSDACSAASAFYLEGRGVAQDAAKSEQLLRRACEGNDRASCLPLAIRYLTGSGVKRDRAKYKAYLMRACEGGSDLACRRAKNEQN
ncbi:hypothetical protein AKJ09_07661 [Labilithrix luteola]|uniref:Uncharacterized protein n=1 Tax=Labilithrix luteola TaxID=1391654 RepID=A0A0K1Q5I5_9BACT|nr:SEL1-like repeat protein [Labilithrix luteola]AKV00998.1 hypothetical protein AKJ09_07661 [Labilithrix luteola]